MSLSDRTADFHMREFESIRKEIEIVLAEAHAIERYVIVAVGVTWGWLWKEKPALWAYFVPLLFAVLGALRSYGIKKSFDTFHGYLLELESSFVASDGPQGWEHYLDKKEKTNTGRKELRIRRKTGYSSGSIAFWALLIAATLSVVLLRYVHRF